MKSREKLTTPKTKLVLACGLLLLRYARRLVLGTLTTGVATGTTVTALATLGVTTLTALLVATLLVTALLLAVTALATVSVVTTGSLAVLATLLLTVTALATLESTLATTAVAASGLGVGHVNSDVSAVELLLVLAGDSGVGRCGLSEGDETETSGSASLSVGHDDTVDDLSVLGESPEKAILVSVPVQVSDVNLSSHFE